LKVKPRLVHLAGAFYSSLRTKLPAAARCASHGGLGVRRKSAIADLRITIPIEGKPEIGRAFAHTRAQLTLLSTTTESSQFLQRKLNLRKLNAKYRMPKGTNIPSPPFATWEKVSGVMPLLRYLVGVGGVLLGLMLVLNAYLPEVQPRSQHDIDKTAIRVMSAPYQGDWVIDNTPPVTRNVPPAPTAAALDAFAKMGTDSAPNVSDAAATRNRDAQAPRKRHVAQRSPARVAGKDAPGNNARPGQTWSNNGWSSDSWSSNSWSNNSWSNGWSNNRWASNSWSNNKWSNSQPMQSR